MSSGNATLKQCNTETKQEENPALGEYDPPTKIQGDH